MTTTVQNSNLKIYFNIIQAFFEIANFLLFFLSLISLSYYKVFFWIIPFAFINLILSFIVENKSRFFSLSTLILSMFFLVVAWIPLINGIFAITAMVTTAFSIYTLYQSFGHLFTNLIEVIKQDFYLQNSQTTNEVEPLNPVINVTAKEIQVIEKKVTIAKEKSTKKDSNTIAKVIKNKPASKPTTKSTKKAVDQK